MGTVPDISRRAILGAVRFWPGLFATFAARKGVFA